MRDLLERMELLGIYCQNYSAQFQEVRQAGGLIEGNIPVNY